MAVSTDFVLHGISPPSGNFLSQITNVSANTQITTAQGIPAGLPWSRFNYNLVQNPDFTFDCRQIKSVLDITGTSLGDISAGNTDLLFKATTNKGTRVADATTSHVRFRAPEAVLIPQSISASGDSPASMSCRLVCLYDGTNAPLTPTSGVALSGTPTAAEHFVLGPVSINSSAVPGVVSSSIDFGLRLIERRSDGELYITWLAVAEFLPIVTIQVLTSALPTYGLNGTALTAMSVWFRKCAQTARVANATEEHILFTATSGLITVPSVTGGNNDESITTIRIELSGADATTAPLAVDTTAAIT